ncbi:MAG: MGMT family protein [Candidatus Berkelbacteria bacterium]|nr:MGMT family protein [Candidatus Berkelbacteria bacterium]
MLHNHKQFTKRVLQVVSRIPRGKLMTYLEVAKLAGSPKAYRAVGTILRTNFRESQKQFPIAEFQPVPCHRVIRSDHKVGEYALGIKKKEALLEKEGHVIDKHKIKLPNLA